MKILHLTGDWKWTGPAEPMVNAVLGLRARGHTADAAFAATPPETSGALEDRARERGVESVLDIPRGTGLRPLGDRAVLRSLRDLLRGDRYEIVHTYHTRAHLLARTAARGLPTRVVAAWAGGDPLPDTRWRRLRFSPRAAHGLAVLSERIADSAVRLGWPRHRIGVVPGAVDTERFSPRERSEKLGTELGVSPDQPRIGIVARIQPHRRWDLLLDAVERARVHAPDLRVLVVGRGTRARSVLEEPLRRRGLGREILPTGYRRDDYRDVLGLMDAQLLLVPGSDGSCRAVLEAMAMGIPTIATRRGILPEIVVDGETGRIVDEDPEILAEVMLEVCRDPEAWALRGKAARARILERFTVAAQAERLERFYSALGAS